MVESRPTWRVEACSPVIATSGSASRLTWLPKRLTVSADHSRMKSRCRQRLRRSSEPAMPYLHQ